MSTKVGLEIGFWLVLRFGKLRIFLHLEDQVSILGVDLALIVNRAGLGAGAPAVAHLPEVLVKRIKVIAMVVLKLSSLFVVSLDLDVVVLAVVGHVFVSEVL